MSGNAWRLAGIWPWWALLIAEGIALAVALAAYRFSYRWLSDSRRGMLLFLRWMWVQAIVLAAMQPVIESVQQVRDVPTLILMVDTSASMAEKDERGKSRLQAAREAIEATWPELKAASTRFSPMLASFDGKARGLMRPDQMGGPVGGNSRLDTALRWGVERAGMPSLGMVLFTDGAADSYLDALVEAERLASMRLPVYPVHLGAAQSGPETWIEEIEGPEEIYVRQVEVFTVKLVHSMPAPSAAKTFVSVSEDGAREVSSGQVTFYGIGGSNELPVPYMPLTPGYHWLEFRLQPLPGERRPDNNYAVRLVRAVARDVSVLSISKGFSFDMGLLTRALRQRSGAAVEVCSVPTRQLRFQTDLELSHMYDAAIVEASALAAMDGGYLKAIGGFVSKGGGLIVLAGPDWTDVETEENPFGYVLAAQIEPEKEKSRGGWLIRPSETPGRLQSLSTRPAENRELWKRFGPLNYRYRADFTFLSEPKYPLAFSDGQPFVVVGDYGRGRVAFVLGGPLYRWFLSSRRSGGLFAAFVDGLVRSVFAEDGDKEALSATPDRLLYDEGEEVGLRVRSGRASEAAVTVSSREAAGPVVMKRLSAPLEEGSALVSLGELPGGAYAVTVEAGKEAAETGFVVNPVDDEARRVEPEHGLLDHVASVTRGRSARGAAGAVDLIRELIAQPPPPVRYVRKETALVPFYVFLAAFLFGAAAEWYLRRRWGLV